MRRAVIITLLLLTGCAHAPVRPFPLRAVMWEDPDRAPFSPRPREIYNPYAWDTINESVFQPLSDTFTFELDTEAINVNALDEVPDSSWFTNRIGRRRLSREALMRGPCETLEPPPRPWRIVDGKRDGTSPGAVIEAADGERYVFKIDFRQPERATAADAMVVRILHAVGFNAPCNQVVFFERGDLEIADDAEVDGEPYTEEDLADFLAAAGRAPDGRYRGSLSLYIDGTPLGGWSFRGRNEDDPNDVVPHQHRRELRGLYVLSSWLNHIDTRAENNMSAWIEAGDGGYVRHYLLDAGDSFGIIWQDDALVRRFGHSGYLDLQHIVEDTLTLGLLDRPWDAPVARGPAHEVLGYYSTAERYVPDAWRNGYPNAAFDRRSERDMAWMARILARFTREDLEAIVELGRFSDPTVSEQLVRVLVERQRRALERWLTRLSPLGDPEVVDGRLCMTDLAVASGIRDAETRRYRARAFDHPALATLDLPDGWRRDGSRVCVPLPRQRVDGAPAYLIVDVVASTEGRETTAPARAHLYETEPGAWRVVGLERPDDDAPPR